MPWRVSTIRRIGLELKLAISQLLGPTAAMTLAVAIRVPTIPANFSAWFEVIQTNKTARATPAARSPIKANASCVVAKLQ